MGDQKTSEEGLRMLANFEGNVSHVYIDQAGVPTIGVGHALTAQEKASGVFAHGVTPDESRALLRADVALAEHQVNTLVKVTLSQHQFDALVSWTFNLGGGALASSTLLVRLNAGQYDAVPLEMVRWDKRKDPRTGQLVEDGGLLKRRRAEASVWINGTDHPDAADAVREAAALAFARSFDLRDTLESNAVSPADDEPAA